MAEERHGASDKPLSRALVASGPHDGGVVLQYFGRGITDAVQREQSTSIWDLLGHDAPTGIHIWEGDADIDGDLFGEFRPLTLEEWAKLTDGVRLWSVSERPKAGPLDA